MKRNLLFVIVALGVAALIAVVWLSASSYEQVVLPSGEVVRVDVADEESERVQGLSGRTSLGEDEGLLFVWPQPVRPGIWMKDMNFAIDILWLNDGRVVHMVENAPPDDSPDRPVYGSSAPADMVLEVSAGSVERWGLEVGDILQVP